MEVQFCGAAGTVTGSSHLITLKNGYKILLDCGLYQGRDEDMKNFNSTWYFKPQEIDLLILSHAHIDHCGRIPKLVRDGFQGDILCTHATRSLCAIMLLDSAKIQERDAEYYNKRLAKKKKKKRSKTKLQPRTPLYTSEDVPPAMDLFVGLGYNRWHKVNKNVKMLFRDAGHILGSANVTLKINDGGEEIMLGFSGDIGRPDRPILRDPQPMPEVDYMICESTYGDKDHAAKPAEEKRLLNIIRNTCVEKKGKLIIPAFSVGRTQEIVYMLDQMETAGLLPKIPVYVDSPLAVNATQIFGTHPECYDDNLNEYLLIDDNPFGFNRLSYVREVAVSKSINDSKEPCIIISASGMMNAGRIRHHIFNNIDREKNTLLIVGYCSPNTLGGILRHEPEKVKLFGEWKPVNMEIEIMDSFSAHADRGEIIQFLGNQKRLKKLFLVHGEPEKQKKFKKLLIKNGFKSVKIPKLTEMVKLK
ncbi:MAG TPA: MBL fold metallo-hydrolase [Phaeodactylibacter sp.]|nr:MBL fold metallo-hydrolase [Phaeodactylibacter sp.]